MPRTTATIHAGTAVIAAGYVLDKPLLARVGAAVLAPLLGGDICGVAHISFGAGFTASNGYRGVFLPMSVGLGSSNMFL